jgi:hypothetical protein
MIKNIFSTLLSYSLITGITWVNIGPHAETIPGMWRERIRSDGEGEFNYDIL